MKNTKKLKLQDLKISSFIIENEESGKKTNKILGGASGADSCHCSEWRCTFVGCETPIIACNM